MFVVAAVALVAFFSLVGFKYALEGVIAVPHGVRNNWAVGILRHFDGAAAKIIFSTFQIVQSVSYSIEVVFPSPFQDMLQSLSLFSVDVGGSSCWGLDLYDSVYLASTVPLFLGAIITLVLCGRLPAARNDDSRRKIQAQHSWLLLLLSFLVLPPVSLVQLRALDCIHLEPSPGLTYSVIRSDTSMDCESASHQDFVAADSVLIALYLLAPVVWLGLLLRHKHHLNPSGVADNRQAVRIRQYNEGLAPLRFLFESYRPQLFYWETVEM